LLSRNLAHSVGRTYTIKAIFKMNMLRKARGSPESPAERPGGLEKQKGREDEWYFMTLN